MFQNMFKNYVAMCLCFEIYCNGLSDMLVLTRHFKLTSNNNNFDTRLYVDVKITYPLVVLP